MTITLYASDDPVIATCGGAAGKLRDLVVVMLPAGATLRAQVAVLTEVLTDAEFDALGIVLALTLVA